MSTRSVLWRIAVMTLGVGVIASTTGCSSPRKSEPITQPVNLSQPQLEGRLLYDRYCYKCHTEGEGGMAPSLNEKPLPQFAMKFQIRHGIGAMPAFPPERLSDEEVDRIVQYIVALRHN